MDTPSPANESARPGLFARFWQSIRTRIISGLLFMLPIAITMWIVTWVYTMLRGLVLDPTAHLVRRLGGQRYEALPDWWQTYVSPLTSAILALTILYLLGYFVSTRFSRALDWLLLRVPGVTIVYKAVRNVFQSLGGTTEGGPTFKRVVLVEFPHPGIRALAFVTKTMRDTASGDTILCVCVLTGVMPPSGFTLFVFEKDAIDVPWSINESLQIILSGGITSPSMIPFVKGAPAGLILPDHADSQP